ILGGSKVSTKVGVIRNLLEVVRVDHLLVCGGMTYSFLKALGKPVGDSMVDDASVATALDLVKDGIPGALELPEDVVVTDRDFDIKARIDPAASFKAVPFDRIPDGWRGVDLGPKTVERYSAVIKESRTVFWNGPAGVFEIDEFARGTNAIAEAIANSGAVSVVGGGESVAAVHKAGFAGKITWISTGGGASLEFLEGKNLPGVSALENRDPSTPPTAPAPHV
ncbi:MAG: phosphoglycerate kinase, partial [Chloroflexi bacterium]|nr:phosphoglycerate kinase [Chloroflexota bacterium]